VIFSSLIVVGVIGVVSVVVDVEDSALMAVVLPLGDDETSARDASAVENNNRDDDDHL
jgi:hypothetical protein